MDITPGLRYIDDFGRTWQVYENHELPCAHTQYLCRHNGLFGVVGKNGVGVHDKGSFVLVRTDDE